MGRFSVGQRVRIEEEPAPSKYVGKMGLVESVQTADGGQNDYLVRLDWTKELIKFQEKQLEPITVSPSTSLANDLFLPWDMDAPNLRFKKFTQDRWIAGRLSESLLFYDSITIPTVDFAIIAPLVHWIGVRTLKDMLVSDSLRFVRYHGGLSYIGNCNGLALFELHPGEKPDVWWQRTARCEPSEAVRLQLKNRVSGLKDEVIELLGELVEICTIDTALPQFQQKVAQETYKDILGSRRLRNLFSIRNTNLTRLSGLRNNQMRVFSRLGKPAIQNDEIDITLRLAMLNLEIYLSEEAGTRDMVTDKGFDEILKSKSERCRIANSETCFSEIMQMENIPDITNAVKDGEINLERLWEFRNSSAARDFRKWFDKAALSDPIEAKQEYVKMLRSQTWLNSTEMKIVRFMVMLSVGSFSPPASLALSALDSFLLDRIRVGYNPRYFIDDLRYRFFQGQ